MAAHAQRSAPGAQDDARGTRRGAAARKRDALLARLTTHARNSDRGADGAGCEWRLLTWRAGAALFLRTKTTDRAVTEPKQRHAASSYHQIYNCRGDK